MTRGWARSTAVAAGAVVVAVAVVGCSKAPDRLEARVAEQRIKTAIATSSGIDVSSVGCPNDVDIKPGATFRCTALVDGKVLGVRAVQRNAKGDLSVEAQSAVVRTGQVTTDLKARLDAQFARPFIVDCGPAETRVLNAGATFTCQAADATSKRVVTVTVRDRAGSLAYDVGGGPAPAGGATPQTMASGGTPTTVGGGGPAGTPPPSATAPASSFSPVPATP